MHWTSVQVFSMVCMLMSSGMSFILDAFAFSLEHIVVLLGKTMSRKLLHTSILDSSITNKNVMKSYVAWRLPLHVALKLA